MPAPVADSDRSRNTHGAGRLWIRYSSPDWLSLKFSRMGRAVPFALICAPGLQESEQEPVRSLCLLGLSLYQSEEGEQQQHCSKDDNNTNTENTESIALRI